MTAHAVHHVHHDPPAMVGRRERLGVRLLIVADGAFVFGTLFTYLYLRMGNTSNGWFTEGTELVSTSSIWTVTIPLVIAALSHWYGQRNRAIFATTSAFTFVALAAGLVLQYQQIVNTPFFEVEEGTMHFGSAYGSAWLMLAGANFIHYLLGAFVALGLAIRVRRAHVDAELEVWRLQTAGSWFTWIAFAGVLSALVLGTG